MTTTVSPSTPTQPQRLLSLDAYRGFIMLMMASAGLELSRVARELHPNDVLWKFIGYHTDHAAWRGCSFWDLIQPAFMFMVGVALPLSLASRSARGQSRPRLFVHALWRSAMLILLGVFLQSYNKSQTRWYYTNVLAQIGLAYPFLFLLSLTRPRTQWIAAFGILFAYWLAFVLYPLPPAGFDWQSVRQKGDAAEYFTGFWSHWEKNYNLALAFDRWLLNQHPLDQLLKLPRKLEWFLRTFPPDPREPFEFEGGGYQTLNFIPSLATMTFGLLAGQLLLSTISIERKLVWLLIAGVAGVLIGKGFEWACPIVKRIWTPTFALYSGGLVTLMLAGFMALIEWKGWKRWAFPMIVAGLNPITLYCMWQLSGGFIKENFRTHFGQHIFESFGPSYTKSFERAAMLLVMWLILLWMYRRKIVLKI